MLQISNDFSLPLKAVTETFAILAKRGMGKTHTASVMVEEMLTAGAPVCVVDPTGAWWGLRLNPTGDDQGMQIVILGGEHGDVPLTVEMAEAVARMIAEDRISTVLDLSLFSKGEMRRFMEGFAETLYRVNRQPLHLVLDEADLFAPQRIQQDQTRMFSAIDNIVRRGRIRGLGITMITQRPAVLNKDVLTQIECLVCLRITAPNDRKAIKEWVDQHAEDEDVEQFMEELASLPIGTAWIWSPGWLETFQKIAIRQRKTFNSSSTPTLGDAQEEITLRDVTPVDLERVQERLSAGIEAAADTDVKALQRRIRELEHQITSQPALEREPERVEVPVISSADWEAWSEHADTLLERATSLEEVATPLLQESANLRQLGEHILSVIADWKLQQSQSVALPTRVSEPVVYTQSTKSTINPSMVNAVTDGNLKAGAVRILDKLADIYPMKVTKAQICQMTGFTVTGGTFQNYWSTLKRFGYVTELEDGSIQISAQGFKRVNRKPSTVPPDHASLMAMWQGVLKAGAYSMLRCLVNNKRGITRDSLAAACQFEASGGTFQNYLSVLKRNSLASTNGNMVYPVLESLGL